MQSRSWQKIAAVLGVTTRDDEGKRNGRRRGLEGEEGMEGKKQPANNAPGAAWGEKKKEKDRARGAMF